MANYTFSPSPNFGTTEHSFVTWQNGFIQDEINSIMDLCETYPKVEGTVGSKEGKNIDKSYRNSEISWITQDQNSFWVYEKLAWIVRQLNGQFYKFDLHGFSEDFQYSTYKSESSGHYNWHIDSGSTDGFPPRKLSLVLQLSDPSEYDGGELELYTQSDIQRVNKEKGLIALFPSYTLHRVTPVTSGVRKTLVAWISGPAFR